MPSSHVKDASFLQQHIEKLILAIGVLVLAVAVFLFVIGKPFAIEINRQSYDNPKDAIEVLVRADDQIEAGLQNTKPLPPVETPDFGADFQKTLGRQPTLEPLASLVGTSGVAMSHLYPEPPEKARYALAFPPVPGNVTHKFGTDVLDKEFDAAITKQYFDLWGKTPDESGDFSMFVASGEFDLWQWVERLKADPAVDGEIKIPTGIWAQRFGIAGAVLLRETWDPTINDWGQAAIVHPMPGQVRVLPSDKMQADRQLAMAQLAQLRDNQIELAQPALPWLIDFVQVAPPGEEGDEAADTLLQGLGEQNLGKAEKEIIKLKKKIKELEKRRAKRSGQDTPTASAPGGFGLDAGPSEAPDPSTDRRDSLTRRIEKLKDRIAQLEAEAQEEAATRKRLEEARRLREEERRRREALRDERDRALTGPNTDDPFDLAGVEGMQLKEGATLRVWAADPSMQPGKTYRYKLLVSVINPLYAVPRLAPDQLQANRHRAALLPTQAEIDELPWIGPVKVEPQSQFLFTAGRQGNARIEIYRRHEGQMRIQEFDGAPGDSIGSILKIQGRGGQLGEVDMRVGAVLIDIEKRRDLLSNRTVYAMIYMDAHGNISERLDSQDKSSPARKTLQAEIKNGPSQVLRPDPDARPETDFGPGGGSPDFTPF